MKTLLLIGLSLSLAACGAKTSRDEKYQVTMTIENRSDASVTVGGSGFPFTPGKQIGAGATEDYDASVPEQNVLRNIDLRMDVLKVAGGVMASTGASAAEMARQPTIHWRGNVSGDHEVAVPAGLSAALGSYNTGAEYAVLAAAGSPFTIGGGRVYVFPEEGDTIAYLAVPGTTPPADASATAAFVSVGTTFWRMEDSSSPWQEIEVKRDGPERVQIICVKAGCYKN